MKSTMISNRSIGKKWSNYLRKRAMQVLLPAEDFSVLYSLIFQIIIFIAVSSAGYFFLSKSAFISLIGFFKQKKKTIENQIEKNKHNE